MSVNVEKYLRNIHTPNGRIYPHLDCWGLVCYVYQNELNIELDLCTDCQKDTMTVGYEKTKGLFTEVKTPRDFDVICYFKHSVLVHVGIYLYGHILHTDSKKGSCFEPFKMNPCMRIYRHEKMRLFYEN